MTMTALEQAIGLEPGVYYDLPAEEYHAIRLPSNSILSQLDRSPAHALHAMETPFEPSDEMKLGTAMHMSLWEPERFERTYMKAGRCSAIKKGDGKPCENDGNIFHDGRWVCGVHGKGIVMDPTIQIVTESMMTSIRGMTESIQNHPSARRLLDRPSKQEATIIFRDPATEIMCKMRVDRLIQWSASQYVIADLKTTSDSSEDGFSFSAFKRGYFRQGAMYIRGAHAVGLNVAKFVDMAVESDAPFNCSTYQFDDADLSLAHEEVTQLLLEYDNCEKTGKWPGYSENFVTLRMPDSSRRKLEKELGQN